MGACITQDDLDAAQKALDELQTAISQALVVYDEKLQAAEAEQAKEVARLTAIAQEADADEDEGAEAGAKLKKRAVAIHITYNGHGFSGMQCNPRVRTIESEVHSALVATRAIRPEGAAASSAMHERDPAEDLRSIKWSRAARTDKGVSACGQVASAWLWHDSTLTERLNAHLPPQIRVLGITRVKKNFNARHSCDSRRYEYYLPQWAFDPDLFPASPSWRPQSCPADAAVISPTSPAPTGETLQNVQSRCGKELRLRPGYSVAGPPPGSRFVFDAECIARLDGILGQYEGVHNFHNFSPAVLAEQMSAQRNIYSCKCDVLEVAGAPWVRIAIHGQSFLLNQIRKMVGLALAVFRGHAPPAAVHLATDPQRNFGTPMAPELGLLLAESCFEQYNRLLGPGHAELTADRFRAALDAFKRVHIFPAMVQRDQKEAVNYGFVEMLAKEERHFALWHKARPIRSVKRPRTAAERAEKEERERKRAVRQDELLREGVPRLRIGEILREEFPKVPAGGGVPAAAAEGGAAAQPTGQTASQPAATAAAEAAEGAEQA
eukprot:jgi/Ulvmu1/1434/UM011_0164.1